MSDPNPQDQAWSRHAANYDDVFLNPFRPGVENPLLHALDRVTDPGSKSVIDLGCGTGPLLPLLVTRFQRVLALDFAPGMIKQARLRLGRPADRVEWLNRPMHCARRPEGRARRRRGRELDRDARHPRHRPHARRHPRHSPTRRPVPGRGPLNRRHSLQHHAPDGSALDQGRSPQEAERLAAAGAEHHLFEFTFGRFRFQGLEQKFWQPFELEYRLKKAGFSSISLEKLLYPWDEDIAGGVEFADQPSSWDWTFEATV